MGHKARPAKSADKKFMFLSFGFKKPSPEFMAEWGAWFESIADRILDQGGLWGGGRQVSKRGSKDLPLAKDSLTGFIVFTAKSLDEAEKIAKKCPVVLHNQVYEIMSK